MRIRAFMLAFSVGTLPVELLPGLPGWDVCACLMVLAAGGMWRRSRATMLLAVALAAFTVGCLRANAALGERVPTELEGEAIQIHGRIDDLPRRQYEVTTFVLSAATRTRAGRWPDGRQSFRLSSHGEFSPRAGMICTVYARLRQPRGVRSAGAFDAERWYFATGIDATGYVVPHPSNRCRRDARGSLAYWRERLAGAIARDVRDPAEASIVAALAVGARTDIEDSQWKILRATGIVHLISVSGLHVGMLALGAFWLATRAAAALALVRRRPPGHAFAIATALTVAVGYAALSGFSVPTQRTVLMIAVALVNRLRAAPALALDTLLLSFSVVLVWSPLAPLSASFWLSFGALGLLLLIDWLRRGVRWWRPWITVHGWMALLLAPLLAVLFQTIPTASPVTNLLAIPLVTWTTVPLSLLGCLAEALVEGAGSGPWRTAAWTWQLLWRGLEAVDAHVPALALPFAPPAELAALGILAAALVLLPLRAPRWLLLPSIVGLFFCAPHAPLQPGEFRIDVLDVGQGLAIVVRTAHRTLLYDTGPRFAHGGDSGQNVVLPFLRHAGVQHLDRLVISHGDLDHAGGAGSVVDALHPATILSGEPARLRSLGVADAVPCRAGQHWQWDGVRFEILHPAGTLLAQRNDRSCVLRIASRHGAALLPGDLSPQGETALLAVDRPLAATLLIVPHHGSAASSGPGLLAATQPRLAVVSAGYRNSFGHPHPSVLARYAARHIEVRSTVDTGTFSATFAAAGRRYEATRTRVRRYWDPTPVAPFPAPDGSDTFPPRRTRR